VTVGDAFLSIKAHILRLRNALVYTLSIDFELHCRRRIIIVYDFVKDSCVRLQPVDVGKRVDMICLFNTRNRCEKRGRQVNSLCRANRDLTLGWIESSL